MFNDASFKVGWDEQLLCYKIFFDEKNWPTIVFLHSSRAQHYVSMSIQTVDIHHTVYRILDF